MTILKSKIVINFDNDKYDRYHAINRLKRLDKDYEL